MPVLKKYDIWIANLNPRRRIEPGKVRLIIIIQSDFLNNTHPSTIICPITTNINRSSKLLRIAIPNITELSKPSDILVDQIRSLDNRRFIKKIGTLSVALRIQLNTNLKIILDLEPEI